jgi:multidrug transporter EmrE-like cation transporter
MPLQLFLLVVASVSLSAFAQLALKIGATSAAHASGPGVGGEMIGFIQSPRVIAGLGLYGVGALLWLFVLGRVPLSAAYPFVGLGFILTMLAGAVVLHENVGVLRVAGTLLIAGGCVLVARSA